MTKGTFKDLNENEIMYEKLQSIYQKLYEIRNTCKSWPTQEYVSSKECIIENIGDSILIRMLFEWIEE